ncbi:hypothetical protein [Streptomyces sp. NPDC005181]|uniref:hypothetical protein n=1 Tax=Streptomyces sp. NPDC005181 TaxID=3156869 RepID=UPI0033ACA111
MPDEKGWSETHGLVILITMVVLMLIISQEGKPGAYVRRRCAGVWGPQTPSVTAPR